MKNLVFMQDYRMISLRVNEVFNYLHSNEEVSECVCVLSGMAGD